MMASFTLLRPGSVFFLLFLLCGTEKGYVTAVEYFWSNAESGPSQGFHIVDNFMDGSGDDNVTMSTESSNVTTTASQVCPVGYFGLDCAYRCYCKDPGDICDSIYGNCSSGCHTGWYGPGCMAERRPGTIAVVVVLSLLLVLSLIVCFALCICIILNFIGNEKEKYRRPPDSPAGGGISYQSQDSIGDNSPVPGDMKTTVPRIKETDIQVMNDVVGKGKFGNVNRGFIKKGTRNTEVAFKTLRENVSEEDRSNFLSLLELYSSIGQHENVVKFYGVCAVGGQIFAAFEYASHGNLKNFLKKNSVPESQRDSNSSRRLLSSKTTPIQFALDVANGMVYLSSKQIIHGKLCAKHVLLGSKYTAKISGLKPRGGMSQTVRWTAPEAIHEKKSSTQCDVWSFGVLLWEIVTFGSKPYSDVSTDDLYSRLKNGYRLPQPEGVNEQTYTLMKSCWAINPDDRPSFKKLSSNLREMVAAIEFQASIDNIDDIDLEVEDDLEFDSGRRFGRIAFDNSVFDIDA